MRKLPGATWPPAEACTPVRCWQRVQWHQPDDTQRL
jgi:hypothetical protein